MALFSFDSVLLIEEEVIDKILLYLFNEVSTNLNASTADLLSSWIQQMF